MKKYLCESKENRLFNMVIENSILDIETKNKFLEKFYHNSFTMQTGKVWMELRKELIRISNDISINMFRSPEQNLFTSNYIKNRIGDDFVYERSLNSDKIERKYDESLKSSTSWTSKTFLFNSGMSCISNSITVLLNSLVTKNSKIKLITMPGYFETIELLQMSHFNLELKLCKTVEEFYKELKKDDYDIVFIEPVNFSIWMNSINIEKFLYSVVSGINSHKLRIFIFDNTLVNNINFPLENIQEILGNIPNTIMYTIESLIKLNQVGLEISNGGVMNISCHISCIDSINFERLLEKTKRYRDIYGQTPSSNQLISLNNEFIYDCQIKKLYTDLIFDNNRKVAQKLHEQSNILKISHPFLNSFQHNDFTDSPFLIIQIPGKSMNDYFYFAKIINEFTTNKNINLRYGTSFGFQNTRYDVIEYDKLSNTSFMRLSIGAFENNIEEICEIFMDASKKIN